MPTSWPLKSFAVVVAKRVAGFCTLALKVSAGALPGMAEAVSVAVLAPLPLAEKAVKRTAEVHDCPPSSGWPS